MADKKIYCGNCYVFVGIIVEGSKLMKGIVHLCPKCETMRKASDLASKTR